MLIVILQGLPAFGPVFNIAGHLGTVAEVAMGAGAGAEAFNFDNRIE